MDANPILSDLFSPSPNNILQKLQLNQTCETGDQPHSDPSPNGEYSLVMMVPCSTPAP